jgi:hypothetical protein
MIKNMVNDIYNEKNAHRIKAKYSPYHRLWLGKREKDLLYNKWNKNMPGLDFKYNISNVVT